MWVPQAWVRSRSAAAVGRGAAADPLRSAAEAAAIWPIEMCNRKCANEKTVNLRLKMIF